MSEGRARRRGAHHLVEVVVIIAGVLLALTADSVWQRWQDEQRELQYLQDLGSELASADSVLSVIIAYDSARA